MAEYVKGHDGRRLTLANLPSPETKRWVIRRKAEVVAAVRGGLLSQEDACSRYNLSIEEFQSWQHCIDQYGLAGLRTTRLQFYSTSVARLQALTRHGWRWGVMRNNVSDSQKFTDSLLQNEKHSPDRLDYFSAQN